MQLRSAPVEGGIQGVFPHSEIPKFLVPLGAHVFNRLNASVGESLN